MGFGNWGELLGLGVGGGHQGADVNGPTYTWCASDLSDIHFQVTKEGALPGPSAPFLALISHVAQLWPVSQNGPSDRSFLLPLFEKWIVLLLCHTFCENRDRERDGSSRVQVRNSSPCKRYPCPVSPSSLTSMGIREADSALTKPTNQQAYL